MTVFCCCIYDGCFQGWSLLFPLLQALSMSKRMAAVGLQTDSFRAAGRGEAAAQAEWDMALPCRRVNFHASPGLFFSSPAAGARCFCCPIYPLWMLSDIQAFLHLYLSSPRRSYHLLTGHSVYRTTTTRARRRAAHTAAPAAAATLATPR